MKMRLSSFVKIAFCLVLVLAFSSVLLWSPKAESSSVVEQNSFDLSNYDIRLDKETAARETISRYVGEAEKSFPAIAADRKNALDAQENLRRKIENLKIEYNEDLRIPEVVSPDFAQSKPKFLTAPIAEKRADILKNFIAENAALFGLSRAQIGELEKTADYTNPDGNLSFVHFEQKINSIPVFRGEVKAGFTNKNEIVRVINNLAPSLDYASLPTAARSAEQAVADAAKHINLQADEADLKRIDAASNDLKVTFERGRFDNQTTTEKIYFPIDYGVARLAWSVILWQETDVFYVIVDARDGTLLWRKNLTSYQTQSATYNVYAALLNPVRMADSPTPMTPGCTNPNTCPEPPIIQRGSVTLIGNEPPNQFNNLGWIPDGRNYTDGNNAEAGIDRDGVQGVDPNGWAFGSPNRNFVYTYNPAPGSPPPGESPLPSGMQTYPPTQFQQGSITNAFYVVNRFHDEMYRLGFTEPARNFQDDNFNRGGNASDRISVEVQDSSGTNGTNFSTAPDGGRGRLQLFVWTNTTPGRDGALDNQAIIHELTHGVSSRLHGNGTGLGSAMAGGMGEGWSDFFALALLTESQESLSGVYPVGGYSIAGLFANGDYYYGLRRFPTAIKAFRGANGFSHNPLTLANVNAGNCTNFESAFPPRVLATGCNQAHNMGEIWSAALWEIRARFVTRLGLFPGNQKTMQIVIDGMKLAPLNPTFLQERDAMIAAAATTSSPASEGSINAADVWRGFAVRGFGYGAQIISPNIPTVVESFNLPPNLLRPKHSDFDGDGKSDVSVFRPTEGNWYLNRSTNGFAAINWGLSTDTTVPADYDGDGKTDIAVFRPTADNSAPDFYILYSGNFTFSGYAWGLPDDVPLVEDYDGDGKADIGVYRPSDRNLYALRSQNGTVIQAFINIFPGNKFGTGDFDGDGRGDVIEYNNNGLWHYILATTLWSGGTNFNWGTTGDTPVPADYDGDGIDDLAVFRPSEGNWYIRRASGGTITAHFGISTDIPVPADYDGDGKNDIAVYRDGTWYINQTTGGLLVTQFGLNGDVPIPKRYLP
jgi:Fungalysin metallopeptidase (M36)/FG-GAP-like repeat